MHKTTLKEFSDVLRTLEFPREPVVIVHSSLLRLGVVEGGVRGVYGCLMEALGSDATLVMPAFSLGYGESRVWDYRTTPSDAGALTEHMRKLPEALRTVHPFHSVSVVGKHRDAFAACDSLASFGPGSPFALLYEMGALNLSIGTDFIGGATFLHHTEEVLQVPYRAYKDFPGTVRDRDGCILDKTFSMYARIIADKYMYDNAWDHVWADLNAEGLFARRKLHIAPIFLSHIRETHDAFAARILANPFYCAVLVER